MIGAILGYILLVTQVSGDIFSAAKEGNIEEVRRLVESGVDVNVKDNDGRTPLHFAAGLGYIEVVKYLISKGAYVNVKENAHGATPLHLAAEFGQIEVVKYLISKGAEVNVKDNYGNTPLDYARKTEVEMYLKRVGANRRYRGCIF